MPDAPLPGRPSPPTDAPSPPVTSSRQTVIKGGALVALVGAVAAAGLYTSVPYDESSRQVAATVVDQNTVILTSLSGSMRLRAYRDTGGIWTVCDGDTNDVRANTVETPQGCWARLERQLVAHARPVRQCLPVLWRPGTDYQRWAMVDLAYNGGTGTLCGRTGLHSLLKGGQLVAGCNRVLVYNKVKVRGVLTYSDGLSRRRHRENEVCLTNLIAGKTPANLGARVARWR